MLLPAHPAPFRRPAAQGANAPVHKNALKIHCYVWFINIGCFLIFIKMQCKLIVMFCSYKLLGSFVMFIKMQRKLIVMFGSYRLLFLFVIQCQFQGYNAIRMPVLGSSSDHH
jgi:hypothetical protein